MVVVKSEKNFLAHSLIITKSRLDKDPEYNSYRRGNKIRPVVENLVQNTGNDSDNGVGIAEMEKFQEYITDYSILVMVATL
jgi:hypothetical protein